MAEIHIHEGESIESALRRFKRKVQQEDIIKEVKKHSFYMKPGEKKRVKQALALPLPRNKGLDKQFRVVHTERHETAESDQALTVDT